MSNSKSKSKSDLKAKRKRLQGRQQKFAEDKHKVLIYDPDAAIKKYIIFTHIHYVDLDSYRWEFAYSFETLGEASNAYMRIPDLLTERNSKEWYNLLFNS